MLWFLSINYGGACVYKYFSPPIPIYKSALCFDGVGVYILSFFPNTNLVGARVYIVHFYHLLYALILIYKLWGPVSISISHHLILYTNLLYGVGCLYFTLSPNTNLPFKSWGPVSISLFSPPNSIYKPALCFNSVCVQFVDITLFPNLPDALWWYRGLCL